ncbi:recombination mediator RecR [Capillibacterium thermochitinicola]|uniref:Recombination protein RecR n=1 Tax=Capillibacterium thermochitinicola TaxID=2699427 RepID=A0A8J6HYN5_9FIRM|nr:recombination mediator RecR [Capillibacterium thermochitinicola]MBA2132266.1 recombination protein RecR [Capillibacterium thermochitinicola]
MTHYPKPMSRLIKELAKLPGIGPKTAQRLAFHLFAMPRDEVVGLATAMVEAKESLKYCDVCGHLTDESPCQVCQDSTRDRHLLCVVEEPKDVIALEKTREFKGVYHVLHGALSPLEGIGPEELTIAQLMQRLQTREINEVILACDPDMEGEATALYLAKIIKPLGIKVTRLARGLPIGGDLEYIDEVTLGKAIEGRQEL